MIVGKGSRLGPIGSHRPCWDGACFRATCDCCCAGSVPEPTTEWLVEGPRAHYVNFECGRKVEFAKNVPDHLPSEALSVFLCCRVLRALLTCSLSPVAC